MVRAASSGTRVTGFVVGLALTVGLLGGGAFAWQKWRRGDWPLPAFVEAKVPALAPVSPENQTPRIIWMVRDGVTLTGGVDDSAARVSSVVLSAKNGVASVKVPKWAGGDKAWQQLVACVSAEYARFDVVVTDQPPATKGYVLVAVGGKPSLLGYPARTGGLAPFRGGAVIENPVVFVFSEALRHRVLPLCETAAMEIAHAYGLDHEFLCKDPMSYLTGCGHKTFQDVDARCGEHKARDCADGKAMQNSVKMLMAVLGPRPAEAPATAPATGKTGAPAVTAPKAKAAPMRPDAAGPPAP